MEIKNKTNITLMIILATTMFACFILTAGALSRSGSDQYPSILYGMEITMTIFWAIGAIGLAVLVGFRILKDSKLFALITAGTSAFFVLMHFIYICVLASQVGMPLIALSLVGVLVLFVVSVLLAVFMLPEVLSDIKKVVKKPAKSSAKTEKPVKPEQAQQTENPKD